MSKHRRTVFYGATLLDPDEKNELIPNNITTQEELNKLEIENVTKGIKWVEQQLKLQPDILNITFSNKLHEQMFDQVWEWAGKKRITDKNIGCSWNQIPMKLNELFENTKHWIDHKIYEWDELATRFHWYLLP